MNSKRIVHCQLKSICFIDYIGILIKQQEINSKQNGNYYSNYSRTVPFSGTCEHFAINSTVMEQVDISILKWKINKSLAYTAIPAPGTPGHIWGDGTN